MILAILLGCEEPLSSTHDGTALDSLLRWTRHRSPVISPPSLDALESARGTIARCSLVESHRRREGFLLLNHARVGVTWLVLVNGPQGRTDGAEERRAWSGGVEAVEEQALP